jgi:hypothetical protein
MKIPLALKDSQEEILQPGLNFINILCAAFVPVGLRQ